LPEVPPPDVVVVVVDASNLQRNLYFTSQVIELGYPTVVALNMVDVAEDNGHAIDAAALARQLGVPVVPLVASQGKGVPELRQQLIELSARSRDDAPESAARAHAPTSTLGEDWTAYTALPPAFAREISELTLLLGKTFPAQRHAARAEALLLLSDEKFLERSEGHYPEAIRTVVGPARGRLEKADIDWRSAAIEARYRRIAEIQEAVTNETLVDQATLSDRLDRLLTHKVWGLLIFVSIMALMFQSIFSFAELPMNGLEYGVDRVGKWVSGGLGPGALNDLLVNGVIKGVGAVVVFLPQICLLFFFIGLLEDTGYMARAAFLMDRLMSRVGLHGKSFIPMLSSFACAIPGIMATRTIENPKDRLVTILVAPLMSCSARLPVYTLLIGACIPDERVIGLLRLRGLTMLSMYLLGIVVALFMDADADHGAAALQTAFGANRSETHVGSGADVCAPRRHGDPGD
jgi:ferrous iron transport protein B